MGPDQSVTPLFSLLVCTVDRVAQLRRLLNSLRAQTCRDFELVVVDQNADQRLQSLLAEFGTGMRIKHIAASRGLSKARNTGLHHCSGKFVALPDDDCWYPPGLLERVLSTFSDCPDTGFIVGRWQDETGRDGFRATPAVTQTIEVNHIWTQSISFTLFFRQAVMSSIGPFDERLGVGAGTPWNAGEETDYLLRAARLGIPGVYDPECIVHHPRVVWSDRGARTRALSYGRGIGFVLRKNRAGVGMVARFLFRPLGGACLAGILCRWRKAGFHFAVFRGRLSGWMVSA